MSGPIWKLAPSCHSMEDGQTKQLLYTPNYVKQRRARTAARTHQANMNNELQFVSCLTRAKGTELGRGNASLSGCGPNSPLSRKNSALFTGAPVVMHKPSIQASQGQPTAPPAPEHRGRARVWQTMARPPNALMKYIRRIK